MKIGNLVRFNHDKDSGPIHKVVSVAADGMIEIYGMGGYFAPHLFTIADDIAAMPLSIEEATPDDFGEALDTANEAIADLKQRLSAAEQRAVAAERRAEELQKANDTLQERRNFRAEAAEADRDHLRDRVVWLEGGLLGIKDWIGHCYPQETRPKDIATLQDIIMGSLSASPAPSAAEVVPDGYVLVPVKPTEAMLNTGAAACYEYEDHERLREKWTAMLAAYTAEASE